MQTNVLIKKEKESMQTNVLDALSFKVQHTQPSNHSQQLVLIILSYTIHSLFCLILLNIAFHTKGQN